MNIMNRVTLAYMRKNPRRTLVAVIGAALSVAMVTAVLVACSSFLDLMRRDAYAFSGQWQVKYRSVPLEGVPILKQDANTAGAAALNSLGCAELPGNTDKQRRFLWLWQCAPEVQQYFDGTVLEGTFPTRLDEIAVTREQIL